MIDITALTALTPGERLHARWEADLGPHPDPAKGRLRAVHDTDVRVVRVTGDGLVRVREVGYGSLPGDVFDLRPEVLDRGRA